MPDPRPACLITGTVSPYRREPFRLLAEREGVEVIAFEEAGPPVPGLAVHRVTQAGAVRLAASGRYRAVIASLGGRLAPARRLPGGARPWCAVRAVGHGLGPSAHPGPRAVAAAHPPPLPPRRCRGHLRRAREPPRGAPPQPGQRRGRASGGGRGALRRARGRGRTAASGGSRAGAETGELLVLFVGRLEREKGVEVLLRGLAPGRHGRRRAAGVRRRRLAGGRRFARG